MFYSIDAFISKLLYHFTVNSKRSKIFFPPENEESGAGLWIIGVAVFLSIIIIVFLIDYWRKKSPSPVFKKPEYIKEKDDKRKYYRIDTLIFANVQLGHKEYRFEVRDISGGGISFYTRFGPDTLKRSMILNNISFNIPQEGRIVANAVIKRVQPIRHKDPLYRYICAVEFLHISDYNREVIIKYIHSRQRLALRETRSTN